MTRIYRTILSILTLLAVTACSARVLPSASTSALKIHFLDVGQGEAILIECPDGHNQTLIDAGNSDKNYPGAEKLFISALQKILRNDRVIETAINTHPHPDHLYGFVRLLNDEKYLINKYLHTGMANPETALDETLARLLETRGIPDLDLYKVKPPLIDICPGSQQLRLTPFYISDTDKKLLRCPADLNNCSLAMKLEGDGFSVLLGGDILKERQGLILADKKNGSRLKSTILKIPHHGSRYSLENTFLLATDPEYVIISSGNPAENKTSMVAYPGTETLRKLNAFFDKPGERYRLKSCTRKNNACLWQDTALSSRILSTRACGTISIALQDSALSLATERKCR